jgi:hypothetical protein
LRRGTWPLLSHENGKKNDDRQRNAEKPEKNTATHEKSSCSYVRLAGQKRRYRKIGSALEERACAVDNGAKKFTIIRMRDRANVFWVDIRVDPAAKRARRQTKAGLTLLPPQPETGARRTVCKLVCTG